MLLQRMTWQEVADYLEKRPASRRGVIVPAGSTEQHGPTGLIGTDALCAEIIAERVGERVAAVVAPTLALGQAQFNLAFPGTVSLRASTLIAVVSDLVTSLAGQGFSHFYFLNAHGGNVAPLEAAFQDLYREWRGPERLRCRLRSWWDHPMVEARRQAWFAEWEGLHATPSEISITQAVLAAPSAGGKRPAGEPPLEAGFIRDHGRDRHFDAASHRAAFPDGRVGSDPWLASPEAGDDILGAAVTAIAEDFEAFLSV